MATIHMTSNYRYTLSDSVHTWLNAELVCTLITMDDL